MSRTVVALTDDLWTDLGAGPMVVELKQAPVQGGDVAAGSRLLIDNNPGGDDDAAISWGFHELGEQVKSDDTQNVWAKGEGAGWIVIVDA